MPAGDVTKAPMGLDFRWRDRDTTLSHRGNRPCQVELRGRLRHGIRHRDHGLHTERPPSVVRCTARHVRLQVRRHVQLGGSSPKRGPRKCPHQLLVLRHKDKGFVRRRSGVGRGHHEDRSKQSSVQTSVVRHGLSQQGVSHKTSTAERPPIGLQHPREVEPPGVARSEA